jgi:hypothetical protein
MPGTDREATAASSPGLQLTTCPDPECRAPAEIYAEANLTDIFGAPTPHARILCLSRHFFCMPTERLPSLVMQAAAEAASAPEPGGGREEPRPAA